MARMGWREANRARWVGIRPAHEGTQIWGLGVANNNTVAIYTVPAGRVLYLARAALLKYDNVSVASWLGVRDAGDVLVHYLCSLRYQADQTVTSPSAEYFPPLEIPAGYDLAVYSSVVTNVYGSYFGWLQ